MNRTDEMLQMSMDVRDKLTGCCTDVGVHCSSRIRHLTTHSSGSDFKLALQVINGKLLRVDTFCQAGLLSKVEICNCYSLGSCGGTGWWQRASWSDAPSNCSIMHFASPHVKALHNGSSGPTGMPCYMYFRTRHHH